jgi:glycoprotein-N-acetylgalactosamine 3-beta-galactosyltransferase
VCLLVLLWCSLGLLVFIAVRITPPSAASPVEVATRRLDLSAAATSESACLDNSRVERYDAPLLPTIVVISSSPSTMVTDTLLAARAVVLNSFAAGGGVSIVRLILLDASGQLAAAENGGGASASAAIDLAQLRKELQSQWRRQQRHMAGLRGAGGAPSDEEGGAIDVLGAAGTEQPSAGVRSDETAFRASVEPYLWQLAEAAPHALVWLDATVLVEPGWLAPLVTAVTDDPYVMAVPSLRGAEVGGSDAPESESESEYPPAAFAPGALAPSSGGRFDWALNYYELPRGGTPGGKHEPNGKTTTQRVGSASAAVFAVHSDWWKALGGFTAAVEAGLATGFWASNLAPVMMTSSSREREHPLLPGSGAPSLELSLRFWGCGGAIHVAPCSVAQRHLPRGRLHSSGGPSMDLSSEGVVLSGGDGSRLASIASALRVAELWLADHAPNVWAAHGVPRDEPHFNAWVPSAGVAEKIRSVRERFGSRQCRGAEWYLSRVSPTLFFAPTAISEGTKAPPMSVMPADNGRGPLTGSSSPAEVRCIDRPKHADHCGEWQSQGQCKGNPLFMHWACPKSCSGCTLQVKNGRVVPRGQRRRTAEVTNEAPASSSFSSAKPLWQADSFAVRLAKAHFPPTLDVVDVYHLAKLRDDALPSQSPPFPPPSLPADELSGVCARKDLDANGKLLKQITVATDADIAAAERRAAKTLGAIAVGQSETRRATGRLMCIVYCTKSKHDTAVEAVRRTWANKCDGFTAMSDSTDPDIPALNVSHEGKEEYNNIWQKVRSIWLLVYQRHYRDFDWFSIGGDDLYIIVENLRLYLNSEEITRAAHPANLGGEETPLFLGRRFAQGGNVERMFNSGGAGYVLNRAALKLLAENALDNPLCQPHLKGFWEDVQVANCLKKAAGVLPFDTRDEHGRERFHPFTPANHLVYRVPKSGKDWYAKYSIDLKEGEECCSANSVSFHYVKHQLMPKIHALLYDCRRG